MLFIFHMADGAVWAAAQTSGIYSGTADDRRDGFIHFSTAMQLRESAAKHRAGRTGLFLLKVAAENLGERLKWEPARGGQLFPHLHGPLLVEAVSGIHDLPVGPDGHHVFPPGIA